MKRSEINLLIEEAIIFFRSMNFHLPPWACYSPEEWKRQGNGCSEVFSNMLGWDLTDFGSGHFKSRGLLLFTLRNGNPELDKKPYAEKIMIVEENQETPMHFHWQKMEDIINRGGGNLVIELFNSGADESMLDTEVRVKTDGFERALSPGTKLVLHPGESICLTTGLYHRFYAQPGKGKVLVGEVSAVNDDTSDNRFHEPVGRFPEIEEDVNPKYLLVSDYTRLLS